MKNNEEKDKLDKIFKLLNKNKSNSYKISNSDISFLIQNSIKLFLKEPNIIEIKAPYYICGDIHGQFPDLLNIFEKTEYPPNSRFLFLGDYVDRGDQSIEVICLLLTLKLKYPNHIYLLRGNHETKEMTQQYGFQIECQSKQNKQIYLEFCDLFDTLPLAALINEKIFCIHGGLTPDLNYLDQIKSISRPVQITEHGFLADLVWSDPCSEIDEWAPSERGLTVKWGLKVAKKFMENNKLNYIIRAHQMAEEGIDYPFNPDKSIITVFSAPWYANEFHNLGGYLYINKNLEIKTFIISRDHNSNVNNITPIILNKKNKNDFNKKKKKYF